MDVRDFLCVLLGSKTIQFHNSLCSRWTCTHSKAGFCSQNGDCAWGCTNKEQHYVVRFFCGQKNRIFIKKCFLFTVGSVCHVKWFTTGSKNSLKDVRKSQTMPDHVHMWLRQRSEVFYAAGFNALLKLRDKCIKVWISHFLHFKSICDQFTDSLLYKHLRRLWVFCR
jgi:hypothetical protein